MIAIRSTELGVSDDDLADAPQLELWLPVRNQFGVLALWGQVTDHPTLGKITSSPRLLSHGGLTKVGSAPSVGCIVSASRSSR